jgi:hypothetical protein
MVQPVQLILAPAPVKLSIALLSHIGKHSVADLNPGSGIRRLFTPRSGKGFPGSRILDPRSPNHMFESLVQILWVKGALILCQLAPIFSVPVKKRYSWLHKKVRQEIPPPPLLLLLLDPKSEVRDLGWLKMRIRSGIRDKHPGSSTLGLH